MTRSKSRTRRWKAPMEVLDHTQRPVETPASRSGTERRSGDPVTSRGAGPYESSYDVTLGYGMERSIILP